MSKTIEKPKKVLTSLQQMRFEGLKVTIRNGFATAFQIGEALKEVRDSEYYLTEADTFEAWCRKEYEISRRQAYYWIEAAEVRKALPDSLRTIVHTESQARELAVVEPAVRVEILEALKEAGQPITARAIRQKAGGKNGHKAKNDKPEPEKPKAVIELDKLDNEIADKILAEWKRAEEIAKHLISLARELKLAAEHGVKEHTPAFAELAEIDLADFERVSFHVKKLSPYCICPNCQGHNPKQCKRCGHRGFISYSNYKTFAERSK